MNLQGRDLKLDMRGDDVALLHRELATIGLSVPDDEGRETLFGPGTREAVIRFQMQSCLEPTGVVDVETAHAINAAVDAMTFTVGGKVVSRLRAGVGGLRVEVVDKNVGADAQLAEAATDDEGGYCATFNIVDRRRRGKRRPDLQARAFAGETFVGASKVIYDASNRETLDIILTEKAAAALPSEHETLSGALSVHFQGNLRDLKETADRQDITYLANKTGWDARAIALAALADKFSADSMDARNGGIESAFFYALFRAGLQANEETIYQTSAKIAAGIWKQGIDQGVISASLESMIPQAESQFQRLAAERALESRAPTGPSSLREMLTISLGDDPAKQTKFAELYSLHQGNPPQFWEAVKDAFGESTERRLKLDGQLAYLTLNNAPLIRNVHDAAGQGGLTDTASLASGGYYRAEKWRQIIGDGVIPSEISGENDEEKRSKYAEALAAQIRLSFPTSVVAQMVKIGETPVVSAVADQVHAFLSQHQSAFNIGMQPVEQYLVRNNLQLPSAALEQIIRIQRVYQITPSDSAMNALLNRGLDSAYAVTRYNRDQFIRAFKDELGGEANARLIHDRSQQVHNLALNVAFSYLTAGIAPAIGVHSPPNYLDPTSKGPSSQAANAGAVIAYPTLEGLFGEMDFCACYHCRSILSPAAYLVDLLLFLDREDQAWSTLMTNWKSDHGNAPYPFASIKAWNDAGHLANTEITPLNVLLERRPDIQHLPLTCENTNTPLPYIDLVNETLEYFIANDIQNLSLDGYQGHSTSAADQPEELLASPQFVRDAAYTTLAGVHFPSPLPFHRPLENLRRYFNRFETPLSQVMEALRQNDNLERMTPVDPANPIEYGWRDILMEELGFSRAEHKILTNYDPDPPANAKLTLQQLYGYAPAASAADVLGGYLFSVGLNFIGDLDKGTISQTLRQLFEQHGKALTQQSRVEVKKAGVNWVIVDAFRYDIRNENQTLNVRLIGLSNAKEFTRRIGLSYEDIIEILRTRFVNPNSTLLPKLEALGVPFATLKTLKESQLTGQAWLDLLPKPLPEASQYGGNIETWLKNDTNYENIMGLITLANPTDEEDLCSFDNLEFRYSDPDKIDANIRAFEFVRLIRFIRLWKKLGWTIDQTDKAITALYPVDLTPDDPDDAVNLQRLDAGFLVLLPRLAVIKRVIRALNLKLKKDMLPLLACFAPIDTHGSASLYRQMFLSKSLLKQDPVFDDDGFGSFLTGNDEKLRDHAEAIRAAFLLTVDELNQITTALNFDPNTALNLENISAVFRIGWMARKLKLSVRELLLLMRFTTLDIFSAPDPPNPLMLVLIEILNRLRAASLKPVEALFLIWNQDVSGRSAPDEGEILAFARALRGDFAAIESEFALADDPDGQIARARMAQVYGAEATDHFFGLLDNKVVADVVYSHNQATLEQQIVDAGSGRVSYDNFRKRLSYNAGVMPDATRAALESVPGAPATFVSAVEELYAKTRVFFDRYPELLPLYNDYAASNDPVEKKRFKLLASFLPELKRRRKRQQALQALSAAAQADAVFTNAIFDDARVLHAASAIPDAVDPTTLPALDDLTALELAGLSAQFFFADNAGGVPNIPVLDAEANLAYTATGNNKLPPNADNPADHISGIWSGYLEAPENGFYNLRIEADAGAVVTLELDGGKIETLPPQNGVTAWSNKDPLELLAGSLYRFVLTVEKVKDTLTVQWETTGRGWEVIPPRYLYSQTLTDHLRAAYLRFLKAVSLASSLRLNANEIAHIAKEDDYLIDGQGWLNSLPVSGIPDGDTSEALLKAFTALLQFARIKADLSPGDERLLVVLKDPEAAAEPATESVDSLLLSITRWESDSLEALLARFDHNIADLAHIETFRRIYDAYMPVKKLRVSASALITAATNEPGAIVVRDLQSALRARYDESDWLNVLKPINDEMRGLQRDALVAYVLRQMRENPTTAHIDTADKLFEYFLMDVQMEPCMQTSRIRHALSSAQLFIERCMMNLEPRVSPSILEANHWEWMKRYRVWEANRKVFLWPENWLEPELRDDQSPFFKEAMSELLQSDITEDKAAAALGNYLSKLEEIAKLEPCGIHYVEAEPGISPAVAHVVARTAGANRKYHYRRRDGADGPWTPWEQIKLDIEDNPVIPVVWKDRLFLFWLRILKEASLDPPPPPTGDELGEVKPSDVVPKEPPKVTVKAVLCWSEYCNGKWQAVKTSDINRPVLVGEFATSGNNAFDRSALRLSVFEKSDGLRVTVARASTNGWFASQYSSFFFYNTHSSPMPEEQPSNEETFNPDNYPVRILDTWSDAFNTFNILYLEKLFVSPTQHPLLKNEINDRTVEPRHRVQSAWGTPFFYEDSRHVFYVTTEKTIKRPNRWDGFHLFTEQGSIVLQITPLLLEKQLLPKPPPPELVLSADAYVNKWISTGGVVSYGDIGIGPSGGMPVSTKEGE
jgi:peptidoglycan hydrolase-like protein with peptidoglycan-binding domain